MSPWSEKIRLFSEVSFLIWSSTSLSLQVPGGRLEKYSLHSLPSSAVAITSIRAHVTYTKGRERQDSGLTEIGCVRKRHIEAPIQAYAGCHGFLRAVHYIHLAQRCAAIATS